MSAVEPARGVAGDLVRVGGAGFTGRRRRSAVLLLSSKDESRSVGERALAVAKAVAIGTSGAKPKTTADPGPPWSAALAQPRTALPWQYGSGVASARVVAISPELRQKLREAALRVP